LILTTFWAGLISQEGTAATLIVSNTSPSGPGSLQQAILDANATTGLDTIVFQIPGTGVHTIAPASALPSITDPVVIDGTTQPGFAGTPLIEINGVSAGSGSDGFRLPAGNSIIRGLAINRFGGAGIHLQAPGGTNLVQGNFIGTDPTGTLNLGNGQFPLPLGGILVDGSSGNWIGGPYPTNGNIISANQGSGIYLLNCSGNTIQGNLVGTALAGTAALGNSTNGITLYGATSNLIGGTLTSERNLISGNGWSGVYLYGTLTTGNRLEGNYIGTQTNGSLALPNAADGVTLNGARANAIGGTDAGAGNLISGNGRGGVVLRGAGTDHNSIQGNYIGTDLAGQLALGNTFSGLTIVGGTSNLIGGTMPAARNVISANRLSGIYITTNASANLVQGNLIGLDATGTNGLGNLINGVSVDGAAFTVLGGTSPGAGNFISGNTNYGIEIYGTSATNNVVQGNYIGPDVTGHSAQANQLCGVHILSSGNTIGGTASGAGNLISGNGQDGIFLDGPGALGNTVRGNLIGTDASGTTGLKNLRAGVGISDAPDNTIGGTASGAGNLISANANSGGDAGIYLIGSGATGNLIQGNKIGTDITGTLPLGNTHEGIYLERAPTNTIGGAVAGAGNVISANLTRGVFLLNAPGNVIQGNLIGTGIDGVSGLGNFFHALECEAGACNTTIGGAAGAGNRLAFSQTYLGFGYAGVRIRDGSTNNAILGNAIFSNDGLGIDLGSYGVNPNVSCGNATGANMAQNYPVLAQAVSGNGTGIRGALNSRPNATFNLQFFASLACDASGFGEGQTYLGQTTVVTSNDCNTGFVVSFPAQVQPGYVITATATDSANNTSEFSSCVTVAPVPSLFVSQSLASQELSLTWTDTATGFVLKQTASLTPIIQWTTVSNAPVLTNGQFVVTLPLPTGNRFYRLGFE